ncbi:TPA: hypothetical protein N0F65_005605 [Lagenidium giganteum]|uniref:Uncharacterized protein n=1 Tax=Lagenidium giganteum TaxID=4803 RepID=A0AAV2Z5B3_9STRA|nr:TPA: hypothetical protein N0F65_005605 [Lagenidium giganteum]
MSSPSRRSPSCVRWVVHTFSYLLFLTDVLRGGVGYRRMPALYRSLETDMFIYFGPFAYSVASIPSHVLSNETIGEWSYKFDTTSIAMRGYAAHLNVTTAWPACVLYKGVCSDGVLTQRQVFDMLDGLADAVALAKAVTLRLDYLWFDRLHHFILPTIFNSPKRRTTQALALSPAVAMRANGSLICAQRPRRPYFCDHLWPNYLHSCAPKDTDCRSTDHVTRDLASRLHTISQSFPNASLDLTVLEALNDDSAVRWTFQGRKVFDVVTIIRVRDCGGTLGHRCVTRLVDDYRYEGSIATSNITDWFWIVAPLRALGQVYVWIRLLLLVWFCFVTVTHEAPTQHLRSRIATAFHIFLAVPSQIVIYGSSFPLVCYVLAHLIDSPVMYEVTSQEFTTARGVFALNLPVFLTTCAVQMRNVWVLALGMHACVYVFTSRRQYPVLGAPGLPEFTITLVSCVTILAPFRTLGMRNTDIADLVPVVTSRHVAAVRYFDYHRDSRFFGDDNMDAKCLSALIIALLALALVLDIVLGELTDWCCWRRVHVSIVSRTRVPFAAMHLWPLDALIVGWHGDVLLHVSTSAGAPRIRRTQSVRYVMALLDRRVTPKGNAEAVQSQRVAWTGPGRELHPESRSPDVQAFFKLMNLVMMTDPLVFCRLRCGPGLPLTVYRLQQSNARLLRLPRELQTALQDFDLNWSAYEFVAEVSSADVPWNDLIECS